MLALLIVFSRSLRRCRLVLDAARCSAPPRVKPPLPSLSPLQKAPRPSPEAPLKRPLPLSLSVQGDGPARIVQAVDTAVWDTSTAVEQTIDTEYLNTDHRMVALPMLGTVTSS